MKGGNEASAASGITQFAEGEPNDIRDRLCKRPGKGSRGGAETQRMFAKYFKRTRFALLFPTPYSLHPLFCNYSPIYYVNNRGEKNPLADSKNATRVRKCAKRPQNGRRKQRFLMRIESLSF